MAIIDRRLVFGEKVELTGGFEVQIGDFIDLASYDTAVARDAIARGEPVWWVNMINDRGTGGTNVTLELQTYTAVTGGTEQILVSSRTYDAADMFTGLHYITSMPVTSFYPHRFLRAVAYVAGTFSSTLVTSYLTTCMRD